MTIRTIRNSFAQIGYAQIEAIINLHREFNDWISSGSNFLFHLFDGKVFDAGGELISLMADMASSLEGVLAEQVKIEGAISKVELAANGMPDLGSVQHDHRKPHQSPTLGAEDWARAGRW
ncbi:hypothetical protein ACTOB_005734 [Actinoplanes oblitus]|uniref:Uncharacterized protein n=1 Tax=Actinoplanes oblitus TaxID=3040509 RepID=A0ABY8WBB8_9ACTN|nr:hypothetical protein [Actinoplanes oblitus]WIM93748.1 hypothetical protein ACTOB_005734 [Actinoplanes oblitus]